MDIIKCAKRFYFPGLLVSLMVFIYMPIIFQPAPTGPVPPTYVFQRSWGGEGNQLYQPIALAVSPDGTHLYVANRLQRDLSILNLADKTYSVIDNYGTANGQFRRIGGIAVGPDALYVTDSGNNRVDKLTLDGIYLDQWGSLGSQNGQFVDPEGIALDPNGFVYVADAQNNRIQKFTQAGVFVSSWGSQGSGNGQFSYPYGIAVDPQGFVYVADTGNNRIQKFTLDGVYLSQMQGGPLAGQFQSPQWLAVDSSGNILVAEKVNCRVQKFAADGTFLFQWSEANPAVPPALPCLSGLAVDSSGNAYASDSGNNRIVSLLPDGTLQVAWNPPIWPYSGAGGMGVDRKNNIYLTGNNHVLKFTPDGTYLIQWGSPGHEDGQFDSPTGVAVDQNDNVYVADSSNDRVQKFTSDGTFIGKFGSRGIGGGQFEFPKGLTVDEANNVYVVDEARIQKFSPDGKYLTQFGSYGKGKGQIVNTEGGIAVDHSGNVYLSDYTTNRILKFSPSGQFLIEWGNQGSGNELLHGPDGVAVDPNGFVFVVDSGNHCIKIFSPDGTYLTQWGTYGTGPGQLISPEKITLDRSGNAYVGGSSSALSGFWYQKFSPGFPPPDPISGLIQNGNFETDPALIGWTYGGYLPVSRSEHASQCRYSLLLGQPVPATPQGQKDAWSHTTVYIPSDWTSPTLSFQYNLVTNDTLANAGFFVEVQDGLGQNHITTLLADGVPPNPSGLPPTPGDSLGWQTVSYDLGAYKGQYLRLVFAIRNLRPNSLGIWAYLDSVVLEDIGPGFSLPSGFITFFPLISTKCL